MSICGNILEEHSAKIYLTVTEYREEFPVLKASYLYSNILYHPGDKGHQLFK